jgi:hypothetical protein
MYSARDNTALPVLGFPIRESAGHRLFSTSPRLIAAVHALLRLLMPRHPPCALTILTVIVYSRRVVLRLRTGENGDLPFFVWPTVQFSRSGEGATGGIPRLVSQNSAVPRPGRHFGTPGGQKAGPTDSSETSSLERR